VGIEDRVRISVRAKPRSSKAGVEGMKEGALVVRVTAPPIDGKANDEIVEVLAKHFGLKKSDIAWISGERSKNKILELRGVTAEAFERRLGIQVAE
jgi:uncharacterized protein (TIGR00251 family)